MTRHWSVLFALGVVGLLPSSAASSHDSDDHSRFDTLVALFKQSEVVGEPKIVGCTLSGGTETTCLSITTVAAPTNHTTGPFCPDTIKDTAEQGGTWIKDGAVYDVDGQFIENLATFYDDDQWQMYDPATGEVTRVEGRQGCEVAGDPTSADRYENTCVECELQYMSSEVTQTYVIPLKPVVAKERSERIGPHSGIGLALNGVKFDAPAPLHLILGGHTLGPFDDCGGHINPHSGYHYHGVAGCSPEVASKVEGHAGIIGLAMDGFLIHSRLNSDGKEPDDLDACRGHDTDGVGYHYHVSGPGENQITGCFRSETGCSLNNPDEICNASVRRGPPGPPRP